MIYLIEKFKYICWFAWEVGMYKLIERYLKISMRKLKGYLTMNLKENNLLNLKINPRSQSLKIVIPYLLVGIGWILLGEAFHKLFRGEENFLRIEQYKGIAYVLITSFFLYLIIVRSMSTLKIATLELENSYNELSLKNKELDIVEQELRQQNIKLKINQEKIYKLAYFDVLTDLPNHTYFQEKVIQELEKSMKENKKTALLYIDLDNFKTVNDTLGHVAGDSLLKEVALKLKECIESVGLLARWSGDEFIILLPKINNSSDVEFTVQKIIDSFQKPWKLEHFEFYITISIGVAICPDYGIDEGNLLKNADTAMYCAKQKGKNCYAIYNHRMNEEIVNKVRLESELRNALKEDEFLIYYQPQFDIRDNKLVGAEALIRWRHPERGILSPGAFIPIAEESSLIIDIGEYVLKKAFKQYKKWKQTFNCTFHLSVNVSSKQLLKTDLIDLIRDISNEEQISCEWLYIEITESAAIENIDFTIDILKELKKMKIKIALDDFGKGYSSLTYLRNLPIDNLKMDKVFIQEFSSPSNELTIAKALINLAHSMQLTVTAEGIETCEQLDFLRKHSCDIGQGYLLGKPLPVEEFEYSILKC